MAYCVWCIVYGVWCMVYGVWCMVHGVWCVLHGVGCMLYGVCAKDAPSMDGASDDLGIYRSLAYVEHSRLKVNRRE